VQAVDLLRKDQLIPSPPRRGEYHQYLGKQPLRPLALVLFIISVGSVYGIWAVFSRAVIWYPFLGSLIIMVPWSVYVVILQTFRPRVTSKSHQMVIQAGGYMLKHSVDVFLPVCGEDPAIISNTIYHVLRMQHVGPAKIYVLDDGNSPAIKALAASYHVNYLVRGDRPAWKKSGNMNNGLRHSDGEFIVVFDADFAPAPEFLIQTLPYMLYDNLGILQTAQYFDVRIAETRNWIQQLSGSIQDMFFCWGQPARNAADAAMCVGTNVIYRRTALEAAGGFPKVDGGGEDVITGLEMCTEGYRTLYVPLVLAKGVCPDTFEAAVNQQYRWGRSSMMMFGGRNAHHEAFAKAPLTFRQKMVFWSGAMYYTQSILVLFLGVAPSLVMFWVFPYAVRPGNYLPIAPAMLGMFALPTIIRGWRPSVLRLILVYSVAHLLAVVDLIKGGDDHWVPTGSKAKSDVPSRAAHVIRAWVVITQSAMWIALLHDIPLYGWSNYYPAVLCTLFQTVVLIPLLLPGFGTLGQFTLIPFLLQRYRKMRRARAYR
jgi:cellulose synthase (UDP-forming)